MLKCCHFKTLEIAHVSDREASEIMLVVEGGGGGHFLQNLKLGSSN